MNVRRRWLALPLGLILTLGACQPSGTDGGEAAEDMQSAAVRPAADARSAQPADPSAIPSEAGPKFRTTNERGQTSYGLGTSVYSLIGSSGLHSDGFSSHLESRLSSEGIDGVKVFVIDDMVVLGTEEPHATAAEYDPLQRKVLSFTEGLSAKQDQFGAEETRGGSGAAEDNLTRAAGRIQDFIGGRVKVATVTGKRAVETIERIKAEMHSDKMSPQALTGDIVQLLREAKSVPQ